MPNEETSDEAVAQAAHAATEAIENAQAAFADGVDEAHAYFKTQISERPLMVVAAAVGVGLLLGALINGPRR